MNFGQMIATTITLAGRRNESAEIELVRTHLNDTYREVANRARLLRDVRTVTLDASGDVNLADPLLGLSDASQIRSVSYTGSGAYGTITLPLVSLDQVIDLRSIQGATPGWSQVYAVDGDTLRLYPFPSAGETITLYVAYQPDEMDLESDEPAGVPAEFHRVIVDGAVAASSPRQAVRAEYHAYFEAGLSKLKAYANTRGGGEPAPARFGRRRRVPHDPSYYGGGWC